MRMREEEKEFPRMSDDEAASIKLKLRLDEG